ncbi:MAG: UDP-N-acetylmuramoyl-tripeptide--D-alanyl-D-alanine ligase [Clostridia bacterium]|nr:UDP-N-acetylmuramoyl-tripeptide--D-alanyl-D-alanine ligase [Clostridia bacterium]
MIKTKLYRASKIAEIVKGKLIGEDCLIDQICFDSRKLMSEKSLFFAIKGKRYDAECFVDEAIKKGAGVIVSSKKRTVDATQIYVENTNEALFELARYNKGETKIIGITGSVGKTTIKQMICSILSKKYKVYGTVENHNNEIGVAQTLLGITDEKYCVIEMGMRGKGEIDFLSRLCEPYISVISNVGKAHLGKLGTEEAIFEAKCEIIPNTKAHVIVPNEWRFKCLNYGSLNPLFIGAGADAYACNISYLKKGISFDVFDKKSKKIIPMQLDSVYEHDAQNCAFAYMVGKLCGVSIENIKSGILEFKNCKNRGELISIGKFSIINDTYNASFESVKGALQGLVQLSNAQNKRSIALLGDMLEMGENSAYFHKKIGEFSRKIGIYNVISIGEFSSQICEGFGGGIMLKSNQEAINYIAENLGNGDILLLKASRGMYFEKILEGLKEKINEN